MTRRGKYGNKPTTKAGYKFDSQAEARYFLTLELLQRGGQISELAIHPRFELQPSFKRGGKTVRAIVYEADFSYRENGRLVVCDVKGSPKTITADAKIKHKLLLFKYPHIDFQIVFKKDIA